MTEVLCSVAITKLDVNLPSKSPGGMIGRLMYLEDSLIWKTWLKPRTKNQLKIYKYYLLSKPAFLKEGIDK